MLNVNNDKRVVQSKMGLINFMVSLFLISIISKLSYSNLHKLFSKGSFARVVSKTTFLPGREQIKACTHSRGGLPAKFIFTKKRYWFHSFCFSCSGVRRQGFYIYNFEFKSMKKYLDNINNILPPPSLKYYICISISTYYNQAKITCYATQ